MSDIVTVMGLYQPCWGILSYTSVDQISQSFHKKRNVSFMNIKIMYPVHSVFLPVDKSLYY